MTTPQFFPLKPKVQKPSVPAPLFPEPPAVTRRLTEVECVQCQQLVTLAEHKCPECGTEQHHFVPEDAPDDFRGGHMVYLSESVIA